MTPSHLPRTRVLCVWCVVCGVWCGWCLRPLQEKTHTSAAKLGQRHPTYGKGRDIPPRSVPRRPQLNITLQWLEGQVTGRHACSVPKLPKNVVKRLDTANFGMPTLLIQTHEAIRAGNTKKCRDALQDLVMRLFEEDGMHVPSQQAFVTFGGVQVLCDLLYTTRWNGEEVSVTAANPTVALNRDVGALRKEALALLREICFSDPAVAETLGSQHSFIVQLFALTGGRFTFEPAVGLIEEILAFRETTFSLVDVQGLGDLVRSLSARQLAYFCRVLALVVFEPEERASSETLKVVKSNKLLELRRERAVRGISVTDRNHAVLLGIRLFLKRLLQLLRLPKGPTAYTDQVIAQFPTTADLLSFLYALDNTNDWVGEEEDEDHGSSHDVGPSVESRDLGSSLLTLKELTLAAHQVEIIFVLCTLLGGRRKADVQDSMARLGLVPILCRLFDQMEWDPNRRSVPHPPIHGPDCECNPDSALKIQFLRLINNFCDRDSGNWANKHLLLSEKELHSIGEVPMPNFATMGSYGDQGLLTRLLTVLMHEPPSSHFRFWLACCIESFLRGGDPRVQLFVARSGLLHHLLDQIMGDAALLTGTLQANFDLLGELLKCNREAIAMFTDALSDSQFRKLIEIVVTSLVDSNVFLRSLVLSLEYFLEQDCRAAKDNWRRYPFSTCRIQEFLDNNRLPLLRDLMSVVSFDDVSQENICCLNTALVFLLYGDSRGQLAFYLNSVREYEKAQDRPGTITSNFASLLEFWWDYYSFPGKDRMSLELSSGLSFMRWRELVKTLTSSDPTNPPTSLFFRPPTSLPNSTSTPPTRLT